jgi:hypothetical protein
VYIRAFVTTWKTWLLDDEQVRMVMVIMEESREDAACVFAREG